MNPLASPTKPAAPRRRFAVVTTCHARGWEDYGRRMVESYLQHAPEDVPLWLYAEGFEPAPVPGRLVVHDLVAASPGLMAFKARHRDNPAAHGRDESRRFKPHWAVRPGGRRRLRLWERFFGFRWNAVRFAHKSFAIFEAARAVDADVLVWIDADTLLFDAMTHDLLERVIPPDCVVSCLQRPDYSECGFVAYNLRHPACRDFLADFEAMYTQDRLFQELEFHDSFLFDVVRRRFEHQGHRSHDIAEGIGWKSQHVLINSVLGSFMDHMKGDRKDGGASRSEDLVVPRPEAYWAGRNSG